MLTAEEKKWVKRVQRALDACPSDRLGFFTIGDHDVQIYDCSKEDEINAARGPDFCQQVDQCDADFFTSLRFPRCVHSTAG